MVNLNIPSSDRKDRRNTDILFIPDLIEDEIFDDDTEEN